MTSVFLSTRMTFDDVTSNLGLTTEMLHQMRSDGLDAYCYQGIWFVQRSKLDAFIEDAARRKNTTNADRKTNATNRKKAIRASELCKILDRTPQTIIAWRNKGLPCLNQIIQLEQFIEFIHAPKSFGSEGARLTVISVARNEFHERGLMSFEEFDEIAEKYDASNNIE